MNLDFEQEIVQEVRNSIAEAIKKRLTDNYQNPLNQVIDAVIKKHEPSIQEIFDVALNGALNNLEFKMQLQQACAHKLARVITSKMEGEIEKRANELRSSPEFRARCILAIEACVKDCSK